MTFYKPNAGVILQSQKDDGSSTTWVFDGNKWTLLLTASTNAPIMSGGTMATDDATGNVIVLDYFGSTWRWDGWAWVELAVVTLPPRRRLEAMTYDSTRQEIVVFGGLSGDGQTQYSDTWIWDGQTWIQRV